jgi:hypothetical protein
MKNKGILLFAGLCCLWISCASDHLSQEVPPKETSIPVERVDTLGMMILYPKFLRVDLVCGTMPSKQDSSVILMVAGAYTGELLEEFMHKNIAGDHVSSGKRYKGYKCKRNTGAFVFYNDKWDFLYKNYSYALDEAAKHGGAGFAQELIIHDGVMKPTVRSDANQNIFRALCSIGDRLCIIQSQKNVKFGDFKASLKKLSVTNAIYLDMGSGWNYGWYRGENGLVYELFKKPTRYSTNWVTFYQ